MAVAYDATGAGSSYTGSSTSFNHVCTGSNLYLIVVVAMAGAETSTAVTYNSVAMTLLQRETQGSSETHEAWGLAGPATGTNSVAITKSASSNFAVASSISFTGVDQATSLGTIAHTNGNGGNPSGLTVNGAATGMFLTTVGGNVGSTSTLTLGTSGATSRSNVANPTTGAAQRLGVATVPGATSISDSWTWSVGANWCQIGVPLLVATAVTSVPSGFALLGVGS